MAVRALGIFLNFALVLILAVSQVSSRSVVIFSGVRCWLYFESASPISVYYSSFSRCLHTRLPVVYS